MYLFFRIFFTVLAAIFVGAVLPLGTLLGWHYALCSIAAAVLSYMLMLLFKQKQLALDPPAAIHEEEPETKSGDKQEKSTKDGESSAEK